MCAIYWLISVICGTDSGFVYISTSCAHAKMYLPPRISFPRPPSFRDDDVVDNEGMGRKSSKRCCIFHKQRAFGESSTDSSDYDSDDQSSGDSDSADGGETNGQHQQQHPKKTKKHHSHKKKIAHKKKIPDSQRFHA